MTVTSSTLFHLTFVIPVDAGDLDLLSWNIFLNKFLSLQSVPECGFPSVPVPSDDNFHWGKEETDKVIKHNFKNAVKSKPTFCKHYSYVISPPILQRHDGVC